MLYALFVHYPMLTDGSCVIVIWATVRAVLCLFVPAVSAIFICVGPAKLTPPPSPRTLARGIDVSAGYRPVFS